MKVYKFGGASVNSIDRIKNLAHILRSENEKVLVVISAMGKTTNALEKVAEAFYRGENDEALKLFEVIKQAHLTTLKYLVTVGWQEATEQLQNFFTEIEWLLHDKPVKDYNYYYDQVVCIGELLSTSIVSSFLKEEKINNNWLDVRDVLRTDDTFRDAVIDWAFTQQKVNELVVPSFTNCNLVITQGFIGVTDENESTTLGREGSDYTAAVFASMLGAESLTIWKDVEGVMNADPKEFNDAVYIPALSYDEIIEMAFYGAQVIHPKTIKPVENKNIPLYVKCFLEPGALGSVVTRTHVPNLPPIKVLKQAQVLMILSSTDFSFVGEKPLARLYEIFAELKMRPNLVQSTAISILCCLDDVPEKIEKLAVAASVLFDVALEKNLTLLTIRHYLPELITTLSLGKSIVLEQKTPQTVQVLMR